MSDDVIAFTRFEDFDLGLDELLKFRYFLHLFKGDGFDSNSLLIHRVVAFVDNGTGTFTKFLDHGVCF
jgi:hypothetical protein